MFELMGSVFESFPRTCMGLLAIVILAITYRLIISKIRIKVGPVEVDAEKAQEGVVEEHKQIEEVKDAP